MELNTDKEVSNKRKLITTSSINENRISDAFFENLYKKQKLENEEIVLDYKRLFQLYKETMSELSTIKFNYLDVRTFNKDMWICICGFLDKNDVGNLRLACRFFRTTLIYPVWKQFVPMNHINWIYFDLCKIRGFPITIYSTYIENSCYDVTFNDPSYPTYINSTISDDNTLYQLICIDRDRDMLYLVGSNNVNIETVNGYLLESMIEILDDQHKILIKKDLDIIEYLFKNGAIPHNINGIPTIHYLLGDIIVRNSCYFDLMIMFFNLEQHKLGDCLNVKYNDTYPLSLSCILSNNIWIVYKLISNGANKYIPLNKVLGKRRSKKYIYGIYYNGNYDYCGYLNNEYISEKTNILHTSSIMNVDIGSFASIIDDIYYVFQFARENVNIFVQEYSKIVDQIRLCKCNSIHFTCGKCGTYYCSINNIIDNKPYRCYECNKKLCPKCMLMVCDKCKKQVCRHCEHIHVIEDSSDSD